MSKTNKPFDYYKVKKLNSEFLLEFIEISDFQRFVDSHQLKSLFLLTNEFNEITHFATSYKGGLLQQNTLGFNTLEDYNVAMKSSFPNASSFYEAKQNGYTNFEDYNLVKECGIDDKDTYLKMKGLGYIDGFKDYVQLKPENENNSNIVKLENPYQLYVEAVNNGFENYQNFKEARSKGFKNATTFSIALSKGYDNFKEYEAGQNKGFLNFNEYNTATELKVRDREDLIKFLDLESQKERAQLHDQRVLLIILSKLQQGKKVSINKIRELLEKGIEEFNYTNTNQLPDWFTKGLENKEALINYFNTNEFIKEYGIYDSDGEYFETKKIQDRKVVIDGSNVAHNSRGNANSKATFSNILFMIEDLKKRGFTEITIMSDASLKHKVSDKEKLEEIKAQCEYLEAPAEIQADIFIIKYVKMHHCLLVSNDIFREWKNQDPWVALNIDFYRLSFMITNEKVIIPDLD